MRNRIYLKNIGLSNQALNDGYWCNLPFYKELADGKILNFSSAVTFFVGENGCGKSTLTEAIAVALGYNAEGGSRNFSFETKNTTSQLYLDLIIGKTGYEDDGFFLRAESFYNVASNIDGLHINIDGYGGKSLHNQSHGESFLSLVQNRFRGNGLYILDEPEAALSPMRQLNLLAQINRLVKNGSQFIIATHSPILMAFPDAEIYCFDNGIKAIKYTETEHFAVTNRFLNNPDKYLKILFDEN